MRASNFPDLAIDPSFDELNVDFALHMHHKNRLCILLHQRELTKEESMELLLTSVRLWDLHALLKEHPSRKVIYDDHLAKSMEKLDWEAEVNILKSKAVLTPVQKKELAQYQARIAAMDIYLEALDKYSDLPDLDQC